MSGEIPVVHVELADALHILIQLGGIIGAGPEALEEDGVGDADGLGVLHRADDGATGELLVADDLDFADLDFDAFVDLEDNLHRGGRDLADLRRNGGELAAVFGLELLEHLDRARHAALFELLLDGESDVALLETVENIGDAHGLIALVLDGADHAPLGQVVADDPARLALLAFQDNVVESSGVPQGHEIAVQYVLVQSVALLGDDQSPECVLRHAARAAELDRFDDVGEWGGGLFRFRGFGLRGGGRRGFGLFLALRHGLEGAGRFGLIGRFLLRRWRSRVGCGHGLERSGLIRGRRRRSLGLRRGRGLQSCAATHRCAGEEDDGKAD